MAASPEFILRFLTAGLGYRFADSLLLMAAANDPLKIVSVSMDQPPRRNKGSLIQKYIPAINCIRLRQQEASEILPFLTQIAEKEISPEEILEKRKNVVTYFQLLVNEMIASRDLRNPSFVFQNALRNGIRQKALSFYAKQINDLHTVGDATRFASVRELRAEDVYYIITSCGDDLYTSSYLGLYKRLMDRLKNQPVDSIFDIVGYDNFRTFMRLAANYNVLGDFLTKMPPENATSLLRRFISDIESNTETGLEKAMDIADCFTGIDSSEEMAALIREQLQSNLDRCESARRYFGIQLYTILLQVFDQVKQKDSDNKLWSELGNYEILRRNELKNKNGEIIEFVLFYGDEDGMASFNSFQRLFNDKRQWQVEKNQNWITIRSISDEPVIIYANLPLDGKEEMDLKAQDSMIAFLQEKSIEPAVHIHRGHSYHLSTTLQRLKPSVKLAILGSCGGYNSAISIAGANPDVQIIGSKNGSKSINDPIIDIINSTLLNKKDLSWPEIWTRLQSRFHKDEFNRGLFEEYIPPGKNVSLFVLKLFNYYNKSASLATSLRNY